MPDTTLIGGPYHAPRTRVGRTLACRIRGNRRVAGMTDAPIPWPWMRNPMGKHSLFLCGDLVKAVERESVEAVSHHWGVSRWTVRVWRHALGVNRFNQGTRAAWRRQAPTKLAHARACRKNGAPGR